jgi:tetratricopeptide (TPR) repeat protein
MKKIAFIIIMSFVLLAVSDTILAKTDTAKTDTDYDTALKYYNSGKYKEAIRLFQEYIKKKPEPSAYYRIGYALYELRKYAEATEYFKAAYLIDPTFSPELIGSTQKHPKGKIKETTKPSGERVSSKKKLYVPARVRPRLK